jgi:hypothetical protein
MAKAKNDLAGLWDGIHVALECRLRSSKEYLRHPASGANAELYIRQLLTDYLPKRLSIESGFVVNVGGERSDFIDILLVDAVNIAPLSAEPSYKVFPSEAVVAAIEITSAVNSQVKRKGIKAKIPKLTDDILKLARLRSIARDREYFVQVPEPWGSPSGFQPGRVRYALSPRCLLITYGDAWSKRETYIRKLTEAIQVAKEHSESVWINAVYSFRHGMFRFKPYTTDPPTPVPENSLLEFVLSVNSLASSVPTGGIDVRRYRPSIPDPNES